MQAVFSKNDKVGRDLVGSVPKVRLLFQDMIGLGHMDTN
jgi:hypothetical protein